MAAAKAVGPANDHLLSFPRAPATAAQVAQTKDQGYVSPLYTNTPAPLGVAYYGLSSGAGGSVVPTVLNTTELVGNYTTYGPGVTSPTYTYFTDPGGYSIQQNAVLTGLDLFGNTSNAYWTQNTLYYNDITGYGTLVSDTWNWTNGSALVFPNDIIAHGPYGSIQSGDALYFTVGPTIYIGNPFSITFTSQSYINSTYPGEEALGYSDLITRGSTVLYNLPNWDYVIFNSTGGGGAPITVPGNFTANGNDYNAVGLTNDFELDAGGPGGGSQTDALTADANFTLQYYNSTSESLVSVPAALNYGGETGETLTGGTVTWAGGAGAEYGTMTTGPALLTGLWGTTVAAGSDPVTITVTPSNAWVFVNPTTATPFTNTWPGWAPLVTTTTIYLAPGITYEVSVGLSNFDPIGVDVGPLSGPAQETLTLTADNSQGIYTPLWVWENSQLPSISSGGTGTTADPYILVNDQSAPIASIFGVVNDWTYPVYAGIWLWYTTAHVEIIDAAPMDVAVPYDWGIGTNPMPWWFYDVQNLAIFDSNLPGPWWLALLEIDYIVYNSETPGDICFWNSSNNLVADNLIDYTVQGIFLFGGSGNTIWGNTIVAVTPPTPEIPVPTATAYTGIFEANGGDLLYNNAVLDPYGYIPIDAYNIQYNDFTGVPQTNLDTWNTTVQAASDVAYAPGFPSIPLVGSIAFTSWQGGNYWSDYGQPWNPYGTLPYTEDGFIGAGGDYAPLPPGGLVGNASTLEFTETGLPAGTVWSVAVNGWIIPTFTGEISFFLTDGSYQYTVPSVAGYTASPSSGSPVVTGTTQVIPIHFTSTSGTLAGTVSPATASVTIDGSAATVTSGAFSVSVGAGVHSIVATAAGYSTYYNNVSVSGGGTTSLTISLTSTSAPTGWAAGTISPAGAAVSIDGQTVTVTAGAFNVTLAAGLHVIEVTESGYYPYVTAVTVTGGATAKVAITLTALPSTTPASTYLSPLAYGLIGVLALLVVIFLIVALTRGRKSPPPAQSWNAPPPSPPGGAT